MPRLHRLRIPGISQHLVLRGNNRSTIFRADTDYRSLLAILREASQRCSGDVHGYVLMENHVHLLMTPRTPRSIERTMHLVGLRYVRYFNRTYKRTGTLFEGRYRATVVEDERYWITCLRYIELNPVRAGIVRRPEDYQWSSHRSNALGAADRLLTRHQRYVDLGGAPSVRQRIWRQMCGVDLSVEELDSIRFAVYEHRIAARAAALAGPTPDTASNETRSSADAASGRDWA